MNQIIKVLLVTIVNGAAVLLLGSSFFEQRKMLELIYEAIFFFILFINGVVFYDYLSGIRKKFPDAEEIYEESVRHAIVAPDILVSLNKEIMSVSRKGGTRIKYQTFPDNPIGMNTTSIKNYLLLHGYRVTVREGGHSLLISWV